MIKMKFFTEFGFILNFSGKKKLIFLQRRALAVSLLYFKAREAYAKDAKLSQFQVTRLREFRRKKPAPVVKKR
jgi:hypothetical protein